MADKSRLLIVGLGNPGPEYALSRHNAGFMAVDTLAGDGAWKKEGNYLTASAQPLPCGGVEKNCMQFFSGEGVHHRQQDPRIKNFATEMRTDPTLPEKILWQAINKDQLGVRFRRQFNIDDKYIADFVCLEKKLIVEIDGLQHIGSEADKTRTKYLQSQGFRVIRFWNNDVMRDVQYCAYKIKQALEPSPEKIAGNFFDPSAREGLGVSRQALLVKPLTFMNLSGMAVQAAMTRHKIPLANVIVIHDDIDLKIGNVRVKTGGGNAGHNGLKSISAAVGNDYRRIRIGVGRPENREIDVADWVLGRFSKDEMSIIQTAISELIIG